MTATLILTDHISDALRDAARTETETAGVLLANLVTIGNEIRLLARKLILVSEEAYRVRKSNTLSITPEGYVPALAEAERLGTIPIWFHTHPGSDGWPIPSLADRKVDEQIADLFRLRADAHFYGTLIVSPRGDGLIFSGTLQAEDESSLPIDRLWQVGEAWCLTRAVNAPEPQLSHIFDRHIRAFGSDVQNTIGDLRVAIVGCGGTGSAVAEQIVRLGVRRLLLIDADHLSASNVTRVYGSTPKDGGRPKAELLAAHLRAIAPDLDCLPIPSMITLENTALKLADRDLVFGCTDDNAGRLVLSRLSTFLLTPVIDVGVILSSRSDGLLSGIDGRVTVLSPGTACLVCRDRIDLARAAIELRTPEERRRLENEGYAPALAGIEPAVVAFTTAVAAAAVNELLERLIGYGPSPRPSETLLRFHEREISTNRVPPRPGHYCDANSGKRGMGITKPFLEQTWPAL